MASVKMELSAAFFYETYGSWRRAAEKYFDGTMPDVHVPSFESQVPPHILGMVTTQRTIEAQASWMMSVDARHQM